MDVAIKVLAVLGGIFALACWKVWYVDNDDIRPAYLHADIYQLRMAVKAYGIPLGEPPRPWNEPAIDEAPGDK
jgi:hypothetical protein